ncbi:MBL fold metallo-hydrolase [Sphingomonas sp.]|uniref:MBL fold metallo-hydrolase n=1 Tax=Sphingomonas sp. TaxID=28214 RepID=UPI0025FDC84C|nr:MBL fold metallo-hydrolase [Sphingomonas sp.]
MTDTPIANATALVDAVMRGSIHAPQVTAFFDEPTFTISYVVSDPLTRQAAVIDSVWNFDHASGRTSFASADAIIAHVEAERLTVAWILETHAHADHLSAAPYLQEKLGGKLAIGRNITTVQNVFGKVFNEGTEFARDGSQFDRLLDDGDTLMIGGIPLIALHVPGHTPADMAYVVGDALFTGDTLFMPDYGSARCDFPGGNAHHLYRSVRRLMQLPDATRVFLCHDYKAPGRDDYAWETTILAERTANVHIHEGVSEDQFVAMRTTRDATLSMPKLILPALQVNIRAGHLPPPEENGVRYLKLPLDLL